MRYRGFQPSIISEWLLECKQDSSKIELGAYAQTIRNNDEIVNTLYELFEKYPDHDLISPVCHQLFEFYRASNDELKKFTLELVPSLIGAYLTSVYNRETKRVCSIATCLLGIYNMEVVEKESGQAKVRTYTVPTVATASCYHEPPSLTSLVLSDSALMNYHHDKNITFQQGPFEQIEEFSAQNRFMILTQVLRAYNSFIAELSLKSRTNLCEWSCRLLRSGYKGTLFNNAEAEIEDNSPRIPFTSEFLLELLDGVYFAMFNGSAKEGKSVVSDVYVRAEYELLNEVLLVTNAIVDSLAVNPSGQPEDGPIGISIALSSAARDGRLRKSALTNASFRTKRLQAEESDSLDTTGDEDAPPDYEQATKADVKGKGSKNAIKNIVRKKLSVEGKKREDSSSVLGDSVDTAKTSYASLSDIVPEEEENQWENPTDNS
ncbi:DgyrCDS12395 [Dimorphilus gyrociliatus]|uniref:DgyrCDS12395 n=1 Tax=Dimorphilus gyrociliatus TaxID=2664684 RepID=A0A7I8W6B7_9ANNE|nr:DgyrCDS12395 [Dimorphilus gyrociliatus]